MKRLLPITLLAAAACDGVLDDGRGTIQIVEGSARVPYA
jgi:hypothetical protein